MRKSLGRALSQMGGKAFAKQLAQQRAAAPRRAAAAGAAHPAGVPEPTAAETSRCRVPERAARKHTMAAVQRHSSLKWLLGAAGEDDAGAGAAEEPVAWGARLSLPVWDRSDQVSVELVAYRADGSTELVPLAAPASIAALAQRPLGTQVLSFRPPAPPGRGQPSPRGGKRGAGARGEAPAGPPGLVSLCCCFEEAAGHDAAELDIEGGEDRPSQQARSRRRTQDASERRAARRAVREAGKRRPIPAPPSDAGSSTAPRAAGREGQREEQREGQREEQREGQREEQREGQREEQRGPHAEVENWLERVKAEQEGRRPSSSAAVQEGEAAGLAAAPEVEGDGWGPSAEEEEEEEEGTGRFRWEVGGNPVPLTPAAGDDTVCLSPRRPPRCAARTDAAPACS